MSNSKGGALSKAARGKASSRKKSAAGLRKGRGSGERCAVCGKANRPLKRSECCDQPLCLLGDVFVSKQCCWARHGRYTLCNHHFNEGHAGEWKTCRSCRTDFETEMYVWYGTNEFNVEKLEDPPAYQPKKCARCGVAIALSRDAYSQNPDGTYHCAACWDD